MPGTLSKSGIFRVLDDLPDEEIALEDVIERLILLKKVRLGLDQAGEEIPHEEVKEQFEKPPEERTWR